ncbi:hypothetical protein J6590_061449 [Homalodisca vitripennis]|nr:hypothetical protein J6590_061449 [Homalodisca vitripennis]
METPLVIPESVMGMVRKLYLHCSSHLNGLIPGIMGSETKLFEVDSAAVMIDKLVPNALNALINLIPRERGVAGSGTAKGAIALATPSPVHSSRHGTPHWRRGKSRQFIIMSRQSRVWKSVLSKQRERKREDDHDITIRFSSVWFHQREK